MSLQLTTIDQEKQVIPDLGSGAIGSIISLTKEKKEIIQKYNGIVVLIEMLV